MKSSPLLPHLIHLLNSLMPDILIWCAFWPFSPPQKITWLLLLILIFYPFASSAISHELPLSTEFDGVQGRLLEKLTGFIGVRWGMKLAQGKSFSFCLLSVVCCSFSQLWKMEIKCSIHSPVNNGAEWAGRRYWDWSQSRSCWIDGQNFSFSKYINCSKRRNNSIRAGNWFDKSGYRKMPPIQ